MTKRNTLARRVMAAVLAAVMILPTAVSKQEVRAAETYDLAVHYDMSAENGYLIDQSGNNNHAKLNHMPDSAFQKELEDDILVLPGTDGSYVELPYSIVEDLDDYKQNFSVEIALIPRSAQYQFVWTIGTGYQTDYLFMNPKLSSGKMNVAIKTQGASNVENSVSGSDVVLSTKRFNVVTVTSKGQTLTIYVDGEKKGTLDHGHNLEEIFRGNGSTLGYLAKSNWDDPYCDAILSDFKIYNQTLTDEDVKAIYDSSEYVYATALIDEDIAAMDLGNISAVVEDLVLPTKGTVNGSLITWTSSDPSVISEKGKVTVPVKSTKVTLTASFTLEGVEVEKAYTVYVIGTENKKDIILEQYINLPYYLTGEDTLPMHVLGEDITWECEQADVDVKTGKITPSKKGVTDAKLTAAVTLDGQVYKREFQVKILGTDSAYVMSYQRESTNKNGMYEDLVTKSMHLAYSKDGDQFTALLNNTGVLFAKAQGADTKLMKDPYIFRMKDGGFGVLAVRTNDEEQIADQAGTLLFFTSDDLISYEEKGMIVLGDTDHIKKPACVYDAVKDTYRITWISEESSLSYANTTKDFITFSQPEISAPLTTEGKVTDIESAIEGNIIGITEEEAVYILNKLDDVVNTTVDVPEITTIPGETVDVKNVKATANYSDGSSAEKTVIWNEDQIAQIDFETPGTYTVEGTVKQISDQTSENKPFLASRADPTITEYNGKYYFIATSEEGNIGLYIRESDTVTGINQAEQHLVFDQAKGQAFGYDTPANHWAPELHVINGALYIFFSANIGDGFNVQSMLMKLTGDDPTDYDDWGDLIRFQDKNGDPLNTSYGGITLDMTEFSYDDRYYVAWAQRNFGKNGGTSDLWIGEIDPDQPYRLISDPVKFVNCEYGWERNHTFVVEGPNTIFTEDTLYLTYSGGATDETYCVGMTQIPLDEDTDFLDAEAWQKTNYPILTGLSVDGYWGPGHNAYVTDEDGNLINVYHARYERTYGHRDTFLRIVHIGADGEPILDMSEEREILPQNKKVTLKITVAEQEGLPYVDVTEDDWFYGAAAYTYQKKIMTGVDGTHFGPYGTLSRAQFALILYRMQDSPKVETEKSFRDIAGDEWYADAVLWAAKEGIVTGYTTGSYAGCFGPADLITREQMAVMMYRYAQYLTMETDTDGDYAGFTDAGSVSPFASDAVKWVVAKKIMTGKENGTKMDPQGYTARSEAAVMIQRFMNK